MKPLIAGNWKMHGLLRDRSEITALMAHADFTALSARVDWLICPPFTLLHPAIAQAQGSAVQIGAQDCHIAGQGAHTGDISAPMLADLGVSQVILGHSERRRDHGETSALIAAKAAAVLACRLDAIICVGETLDQRTSGMWEDTIVTMLLASLCPGAEPASLTIAYEPVWAIGTGQTAGPEDILSAHAALRRALTARFGEAAHQVRILYGGSVRPDNAKGILALPDVNGVLVGGASLRAQSFIDIARGAPHL
jgi:triosephosphate isomerase